MSSSSSSPSSNKTSSRRNSRGGAKLALRVFTVNRCLFLVYLLIGCGLLPTLFSHTSALMCSTLWCGFILAISFMEAWLKFRAPFCPRPFALDIGRTIFPALNAVELALCASTWYHIAWQQVKQSKQLLGAGLSQRLPSGLLMSTTALIIDAIVLTPKLVHRGKQVVYQHIKEIHEEGAGGRSGAEVGLDSVEFLALDREMKGVEFQKQDKGHVAYIILEVVKIVGLISFLRGITMK